MSNIFKRINDAMSVIVSWIDTPFVSRMWMANESDSVSDEISHVWVNVLHVHLNSEATFTFFHSSLSHHFEQFEIFFNSSISKRRVLHCISVFFHFFSFLMANVGLILFDKTNSHVVKLLEVIGRRSDLEWFIS